MAKCSFIHVCVICPPSSLQLCLGALSQPLSGCIRLLSPGALDPVCDPATLTPLPFTHLSLCPDLLPTCPPRRSLPGPPASRPAGRGRGPWRHGSLQRTQPPRHEQRGLSRRQGSGVELHPASLQALQIARTLPAGESHLSLRSTCTDCKCSGAAETSWTKDLVSGNENCDAEMIIK